MRIYKGRQGWRSAGFNITAVSTFLSLGLVALLVVGLINNAPVGGTGLQNFNLIGSVIVFVVTFLVWVGSLFGMAYLMRNKPQTVTIAEDKLWVDGPGGREATIAFADILYVNTTQVPVKYLGYKASFRGLLVRYQDPTSKQKRDFVIAERDTTNFEDLSERLRALLPKDDYKKRREV